jgi:hypothetical protein
MADEVEDDSAERSLFPLERESWSDALCALWITAGKSLAEQFSILTQLTNMRTSDVP